MTLSVVTGKQRSSLALELAAHLGLSLRDEGRTVCLVAMEGVRSSDVGKYVNCYHPNISTLAQQSRPVQESVLWKNMVHRPKWNLSLLLASAIPGDLSAPTDLLGLYQEVLPLLQEKFDYVILDIVAGESPELTQLALSASHHVMVGVIDLDGAPQNARAWMEENVPSTTSAGVLLVGSRDGLGLDRAATLLHPWPVRGYLAPGVQPPRSRSPKVMALEGNLLYGAALSRILHEIIPEDALKYPESPLEPEARRRRGWRRVLR